AADAVAAHLRLAAVGVVHAHARVGLVGRADEDEAVGADAEMAVADLTAQTGWVVRHRVPGAIDVNVIVPATLPFHETQDSTPFRFFGDWRLGRGHEGACLGQAIAQEALQPLHLTHLAPREEVDLLGIQLDTVPPTVLTRDSTFPHQLADTEPSRGF